MNENFEHGYERRKELVNEWIRNFTAAEAKKKTSIHQAANYSLNLSGKRIRPVLVLATAEILDIKIPAVMDFALAVEILHTASLIHDDLPCLDNDSLRRGEPTCHVKFGEPVALLAGDYLIAKAQGIISNSSNISDQSKVALLKLIGDATEDLCVGQVMDIEAKDLKCASIEESLQILRQRHLKKTAALISASTVCAALINNQKADIVAKFKNFGENLGLLFQITDDILDVVSSAEVLGKNPLRDAARGTPTYVSVHGLDGAKDLAKQVAAEAKASIYDFGEKSIFLTQFTDFVLTRTK